MCEESAFAPLSCAAHGILLAGENDPFLPLTLSDRFPAVNPSDFVPAKERAPKQPVAPRNGMDVEKFLTSTSSLCSLDPLDYTFLPLYLFSLCSDWPRS